MPSIQQWSAGWILMCISPVTVAFTKPSRHPNIRSVQTRHSLAVDPNDIVPALSDLHHNVDSVSTMISSTLQPAAHGHSNPLFGPPDQYLAAGRSIAPSAKSLSGMDIVPQAKVAAQIIPQASSEFQATVQTAMDKGWRILNEAEFTNEGATHLPGFSETRGILPAHNPNLPPETPATFKAQVNWAARFINVIDKLPIVALWYALLEFFILRPGVDMYKEDIADDPSGVVAESVVVTGIRLLVLGLIGLVTCAIFG